MNDIFEIFASLTESFIVIRLCNRFLGFKSRQKAWLKSGMAFGLIAVTNILLSQRDGFENISIALFILQLCGYVFLFLGGRVYEKILISIAPVLAILPINLIILTTFRLLSGYLATETNKPGGRLRIPVLFFSKLAFFLVCEFLVYAKRRRQYSLSSFQWVIQLSCFIITFLIAYSMWNISIDDTEMPLFLLASILIVALNILLYIMMDKMQHDNAINEEYRALKINLVSQEKFVGEARERYMEMRTLRHDMRHYLMAAAELISAGRAAEAKDYIEKIVDEKVNQTADGINTGNVVIDAVINNRIACCLKNNIEMKCMIDSCLGDVNDMDMSILLSNVLDNAISGCAGAESPKIELAIGSKKTFTYIIVKNSIAASVLSANPNLETDKEDKSAHGFGIMSIRKIAGKYRGSVEFREENNLFITEIWLERIEEHIQGS